MSYPLLDIRRRTAFTLMEALVACTIISMAFGVVWDSFLAVRRNAHRAERDADSLHDLALLSEVLSRDLGSNVRVRVEEPGHVVVNHAIKGQVDYRITPRGLRRQYAEDSRLFPAIRGMTASLQTVGRGYLLKFQLKIASASETFVMLRPVQGEAAR
jgi:type II secretory pathway component PulJ